MYYQHCYEYIISYDLPAAFCSVQVECSRKKKKKEIIDFVLLLNQSSAYFLIVSFHFVMVSEKRK